MKQPDWSFYDTVSLGYIGISLLGLVLLGILTFQPQKSFDVPFHRQLTGSIFMAICCIGILVGIFPSKCSQLFHFRGQVRRLKKKEISTLKATTFKLRGHHPTCGKFSSHVLQLGDLTWCAGCMGLVTGGIISFFGSFFYFFWGFNVGESSLLIFWLGLLGIFLGLFQHRISKGKNAAVHFFLNVALVLGAFLLLLGVDKLTESFVTDFYLLALIIYLIITRITLSKREHKRICAACGLELCSSVN